MEEGAFTFYNEYLADTEEDRDKLLIVVYYAFTTLSTVGFGDFNPKSDYERLFASFILVIGVAVFSFIMGNFIEILLNYKAVTAENGN